MSVRLDMRLRSVPMEFVLMLMVFVTPVSAPMLQRLVGVLVLMALSKVQPNAESHLPVGRCTAVTGARV